MHSRKIFKVVDLQSEKNLSLIERVIPRRLTFS